MLNAGPSAFGRQASARAREADDADLVRRAQLGSAAAFEELVVRFGPSVYRFLVLRLRNDSDALDALQETLSAAWQALPSLKEPSKFRAWLLGIATHKAVDSARGRTAPDGHGLVPVEPDEKGILEVREALFALPAHLREVLLLRYLLRLSEHEAAAALGVRVGTVKSRSARARRALLELLA